MSVGGPGSDKRALRRRLLAVRAERGERERSAAAEALRDVLLSCAVLPDGPLAAYVSTPEEPGTGPLLTAWARAGHRVLLPVLLEGGDLEWGGHTTLEDLAPGRFGLLQPRVSEGREAIAHAAAVVVPALAVDRSGTRLGRGGGSYDRALARVPAGVPVIALLYDGELVEALPREPHDRPVTHVATPSGVVALPHGDPT